MPNVTVSRALPIGELSRLSGVNIETIRYYERIGIMPEPARTAGGHRSYDTEHLKRLTYIRRSRDLGFGLDEIRGLLDLVDAGAHTCGQVHAVAAGHLARIGKKIADLRKMKRVLEQMADECSRGDVPDCPIIDALYEAGPKARGGS